MLVFVFSPSIGSSAVGGLEQVQARRSPSWPDIFSHVCVCDDLNSTFPPPAALLSRGEDERHLHQRTKIVLRAQARVVDDRLPCLYFLPHRK